MADPVSLSFAIAGIPGIFTSCVDCFQYIRLGQRFGKDFGFCLAKLEAAQVRLTRWGEPIGLLENKVDIKGPYEDADVIKAYKWLGQIEAAFEEAKETSAKYADRQKKKGKHGDLELLDEENALESEKSVRNLVASMRTVTKERQKHLSLPRKITWALYGKDSFNSLIEDLVTLINDLVELFPSNKPRLEELCKQEIGGLEKESVLDLVEVLKFEVLKNEDEKANKTDDEILSKAIGDHIETHRLEFGDVKVDGNGITRLGDEHGYLSRVKPGNLKVGTLDIKGSGYTHAGHVFYGSQGAQGMHSHGRGTQPS
jgi:Prion-inhibition and propagation